MARPKKEEGVIADVNVPATISDTTMKDYSPAELKVASNPWREEVTADLNAIMKAVGDIAKEVGELRKQWSEDMKSIKNIARSGRF